MDSIILVEDDDLLRSSLETLLELAGMQVTAVANGLAFYQALAAQTFNVALIDLSLPDQNGETLIAYLRRNTRTTIVAITARDTLATRVECYRSGADLFLGKPIDGDELLAALTSLKTRHHAASPDVAPQPAASGGAAASGWTLLPRKRLLVAPDEKTISLTDKECRLMESLAGTHTTVPRQRLLADLYQRQDDYAERALETLVRRTRRKIADVTGEDALILTVHGIGYMLTTPVSTH